MVRINRASGRSKVAVLALISLVIGLLFYWFATQESEVSVQAPPAVETQRTPPTPVYQTTPKAPIQPAMSPSAAVEETPPQSEFPVYVRAWTRDGLPVPGAKVVFQTISRDIEADAESAVSLPPLMLDENGEGLQLFSRMGRFVAMGSSENLTAQARFDIGHDPVHLDLVLRPTVDVNGRVVNVRGEGLADVAVTCLSLHERVASTTSDDQGNFRFDRSIPDGSLLRGEAEGYAPSLSEPIVAGQVVTLVMSQGAQLLATVRDHATNRPVENFKLELKAESQSGLATRTGLTGPDGLLSIEALTPGDYRLYAAEQERALVPADQVVALVLGETARLDLQVDQAASIEGRVVDGNTREAIPEARVAVKLLDAPLFNAGRMSTNADGAFLVRGLPPGHYSIGVRGLPPRYGQGHQYATFQSREIQLVAGEAVKDVVFEFVANEPVGGLVLFADGSPVPGASVTAYAPLPDGPPNTVTWSVDTFADREGRFQVYQVPDAAITFQAQWRGRRSEVLGPIEPGSAALENIVLTLNDAETGTLAGQVLDEDGNPVPAHVKAVALNAEMGLEIPQVVSNGHDSHFLFTDVPAGDYEFHFGERTNGLGDYTNVGGALTLASGQSINDVRLQLDRSGLTVTGVITQANGELVSHYFVVMEQMTEGGSGETYVTTTDDAGQLVFQNVPEGTYRLYPQDERLGRWREIVEAGEHVEVVIPEKGTPLAPIRIGGARAASSGGEQQ